MAPPRRRRRWGRRLLVVLLVLLLILGGLLVVADRVAASIAERTIGDEVAKELVAEEVQSSQPEVSIGGFPFLTQVLAGEYESISIRLRDVEGSGVRLPVLDVDARGVSAPLDAIRTGQGDIVAQTVEGAATVSYASVVELMDRPGLRLSEQDGKLTVTGPVEFGGQQVTATGTVELSVSDNRVRVSVDDVSAVGLPNLPGVQALLNQIARQLSVELELPELPFDLALRDVQARPEGIAVSAFAQNVPLNQR
jgi:hypothetical protein